MNYDRVSNLMQLVGNGTRSPAPAFPAQSRSPRGAITHTAWRAATTPDAADAKTIARYGNL